MKKTRNLLIVILAFLMVFASVLTVACEQDPCAEGHVDANHDGKCDRCATEGLPVTHDWDATTGKCTVCQASCEHEWDATTGKCAICEFACAHDWDATTGKCTICEFACAHATWNEGVCETCLFHCTHPNGIDPEEGCDVCGVLCEHNWENGVCSICTKECSHRWAYDFEHQTSACAICDVECTTHTWKEDKSGKSTGVCEDCGFKCKHAIVVGTGKDAVTTKQWENGICKLCGYECPHNSWTNGKCDTCAFVCSHAEYSFGICKVCNSRMTDAQKASCEHDYIAGYCKKCGSQDPTHIVNYTYHGSTGELPAMWNVLDYESNSSTTILDYTEDGFYTFDYNDQKDGYQMVKSMLAKDLEDITADYVAMKLADPTANTFGIGFTWERASETAFNAETDTSKKMTRTARQVLEEMYEGTLEEVADFYEITVAEVLAESGFETENDLVYYLRKDDAHRVYKITLRSDLKFDNGDTITANDFIETAKRLLAPAAANYRADSFWAGNMKIHNAENYFKQGSKVWEACTKLGDGNFAGYLDYSWGTDGNGVPEEVQKSLRFYAQFNAVGAYYWAKYFDYGYTPVELWEALSIADVSNLEGKTMYEILNNAELKAVLDVAIGKLCTEDGEEFGLFCYEAEYPAVDFADVGIFKGDTDQEIIIVLDKELTGFYLKYSVSLPLVHVATYDSCCKTEGGVFTCDYGTSKDKYVGYGPYKLVNFVTDSVAMFARNQYWWGYGADFSDHSKFYQTEEVIIKQVSDEATRLEMFLKGELDAYGLLAADMEDYQSSQYTYYTDGDSTWFVAINPDFDGLETAQATVTPLTSGNEVNKTILTIKEFRQALSFAVDRAEYELTLDPTGNVAKALYGNMIISDPENGTAYRTTQEAKEAILAFWGLSDWETMVDDGGDPMFEDIDDAIDSITGYNLAAAKALFNIAYNKAVEDELISAEAIASGKWEIQINIGLPGTGSSTYYNDGYDYLKSVWTKAVEGTSLEGHLVFIQSQPLGNDDFAQYLKDNSVDILFGVGWTGSALNPYGLIGAYVEPNYQYDPGWDTSKANLVIELDGKLYSGAILDWNYALNGDDKTFVEVVWDETEGAYVPVMEGEGKDAKPVTEKINAGTTAEMSLRLKILAKIEQAVLEQYDMIPIGLDASASLKGYRIIYGTEEYVFGVGRGGIKYMTYSKTDAEFASFVTANDGSLESIYKSSAVID